MPAQAPSTASAHTRAIDPTSRRLLERARLGDSSALGQLILRYLPRLHRWAHGRLPRWTRTMADTTDVMQDAILRTIGRFDAFEPRGHGALAAYLREAVRNRIRDEHRRFARRGLSRQPSERLVDPRPSPLDEALAAETESRYRAALAALSADDRELIAAHVELDYSHEQLGYMSGRSPNAARMALQRAVSRLAERMRQG